MAVGPRLGILRPRHGALMATHQQLHGALAEEQANLDVTHVLEVLGKEFPEDANGLSDMLGELGVDSPGALLEIMRMLTLSAGYTAVTWAGGLVAEGDRRFEASDVISTSWAASADL